jgi:hypothetical protein
MTSESAKAFRGAGQGKTWGRPTIKSEARRVAVKREVVDRDRGWRWGGMAELKLKLNMHLCVSPNTG